MREAFDLFLTLMSLIGTVATGLFVIVLFILVARVVFDCRKPLPGPRQHHPD